MAKILPFKTRRQLEIDKAVKVIQEWESHLEWEEAKAPSRSKRSRGRFTAG